MKLPLSVRSFLAVATALAVCVALTPVVASAISFSISFQGPTNGIGGIGPGDILVPTPPAPALGPVPPPTVVVTNWALGVFPPPTWNLPELDALSYGRANVVTQNAAGSGWGNPPRFHFSVDSYAGGTPGSPAPPNVFTEGVFTGAFEASADVYLALPLPLAPLPPGGPTGNTLVLDGDGFGAGIPGIGLIEPNPPTPGFPDPGDTLDALSLLPGPIFPVYFSLDARWADPLDGPPANLGSAAANGFLPGDVIVTPAAGAVPFVYAPAGLLGLGPRDDLDALVLWENGDGFYTPSKKPFDWQYANNIDMLFFSVRRRSPIIGAPDSIFGVPIVEGDILVPPVAGGATPGIFIAAEWLGLETIRTGAPPFPPHSDDLDALAN
jgi:hypothetical protein